MDTIKVSNGDIVLGSGGEMTIISGTDRIKQELSQWILEPYGTDSVYKSFGSHIYDYVGMPLINETVSNMRSEISRIVENYITTQQKQYAEDVTKAGNSNAINTWSADDILTGAATIEVSSTQDIMKISVTVKTYGGTEITVDEVV